MLERLELAGDLDGHRLESLLLEIRRLGRRYGFEVTEVARHVTSHAGSTPRRR
jgi:hypothetical protein